jgi:hypothetical protein
MQHRAISAFEHVVFPPEEQEGPVIASCAAWHTVHGFMLQNVLQGLAKDAVEALEHEHTKSGVEHTYIFCIDILWLNSRHQVKHDVDLFSA